MRCVTEMIKYRSGYKYQLAHEFEIQTPIIPPREVDTEFITLSEEGRMWIKSGYAWDGASGPTIDTRNTMTPSLVHDCFCQLIRQGYLPDTDRKAADLFFYSLLLERKMWKLRARLWLRGVRIGALKRQKPKEIFEAP